MSEVQDHNIRLITPPGLEEVACWELTQKFAYTGSLQIDRGGIQTQATFSQACQWVMGMHSITRILWRVHHFKARDFPKIFDGIKKYQWGQWIASPIVDIKVSAKKSRLMHTDRIEKAIQDGLKEHFRAYPSKKKWQDMAMLLPKTTLYVRMENDICTLSLDLAGDALYKRGEVKLGHLASLRENLAFCLNSILVRQIAQNTPAKKLDWMIDPMCGSGTLLQEIANFDQHSSLRTFAFQSLMPCLQQSVDSPAINSCWPLNNVPKLYAFDLTKENVSMARKNCPIAITALADIFSAQQGLLKLEGVGAAIVNPPYGERLKLAKPAKIYYRELIETIVHKYAVAYLGIILPQDFDPTKQLSKKRLNYKILQKSAFENGGIKVNFWVMAFTK